MKRVSVDELVKEVRVTLDENQAESAYMESSTDNMELDEIIRAKLPDAARAIVEMCPLSLLNADALTLPTDDQVANTDGSGYIVLPDDFLRLVSFKLASWNRAVTSVAEEGSSTDLMQRNVFTRGTPLKPVCSFGHRADGKRVMEYFVAGDNGHDVERALYIPLPSVVTETDCDTLNIPHLLRVAVVNYCAGLVEISRGNQEMGDLFLKLATSNFNQQA